MLDDDSIRVGTSIRSDDGKESAANDVECSLATADHEVSEGTPVVLPGGYKNSCEGNRASCDLFFCAQKPSATNVAPNVIARAQYHPEPQRTRVPGWMRLPAEIKMQIVEAVVLDHNKTNTTILLPLLELTNDVVTIASALSFYDQKLSAMKKARNGLVPDSKILQSSSNSDVLLPEFDIWYEQSSSTGQLEPYVHLGPLARKWSKLCGEMECWASQRDQLYEKVCLKLLHTA